MPEFSVKEEVDTDENLPLSKLKSSRKRRKVKKEVAVPPEEMVLDANDVADETASFDIVDTLDINDADADDDDADGYDDDFEEPAEREKTLEELMDEEEESRMLTEAEGGDVAEVSTASASPPPPPPASKRSAAKKGRLADPEDPVDKVALKWPFDMDKVNIEPEDLNDYKKKSEP